MKSTEYVMTNEQKLLIAEFMGLVAKGHDKYIEWPGQTNNPDTVVLFDTNVFLGEVLKIERWIPVNDLKYDTFSGIMSVIEKIELLGYDTGVCGIVINGEKLTEVLISPQEKNGKFEVHYRTDEPKIVCTCRAVVDFLKLLMGKPHGTN